ncbi:MAG: DNA translocase FtsK 4TM domain-containing protein [Chloroflexi bacterium]|nr:DNA translocase FtsK 4TM domain-containing protein [Chloroflexota bacterium]
MSRRSNTPPTESVTPRSSRRGAAEPPPEAEPSRFRINLSAHRRREILALVLIALGGLTLLSLFGFAGSISSLWATLLTRFAGWGAYALALALIVAGIGLLRRQENVFGEFEIPWLVLAAFQLMFIAGCGLLSLALAADDREAARLAETGQAGGYLGLAVASLLTRALGTVLDPNIATILASLLLILLLVAMLRFAFNLSWLGAFLTRTLENLRPTPAAATAAPTGSAARFAPTPAPQPLPPSRALVQLRLPRQAPALPQDETDDDEALAPGKDAKPAASRGSFFGLRRGKPDKAKAAPPPPAYHPLLAVPRAAAVKRTGHHPSLELLEISSEAAYAQASAEQKAKTIEETLSHFGIPAKVIGSKAGPTITQFAVEPGFIERRGLDGTIQRRKVPVNRILALSNDLALALAAAPIRIEAPVPGRNYVGIEVPNESVSMVSLRGVMESETYKKLKQKAVLPFALGRDVSGAAAATDLAGMPHLLIAGATGSGKSVAINAIIACLMFAHSPDELRLVMVDPKRVELVNFNGIPHLLGEVITDVDNVVPALRWATILMDERFQAFSKARTRNIDAYNDKMQKEGGDKLPFVVIIIDELADLMLAAPDETEKLITRLAQMARATGIHLILATQRPSVDVVTGLIKANFPARISFAVTSSVDSRVVLDTTGAEKLLGRGDMLYMAPDSAKLSRLQGCFVSDEELARLSNYWRALQEEFDFNPKSPWDLPKHKAGEREEKTGDALTEDAIQVIRATNQASISLLQRKLGIGYPRAARLMDQLEEMGIVGPDEGSGKPREIYLEDKPKKKK